MEFNRKGERGLIPARHPRFFQKGDHWYIATREAPIGPYKRLSQAIAVAQSYRDHVEDAPTLDEVVGAYR